MHSPTFLVIGAARSGSTYLARNLMAHPEIFLPVQKELHFFDRDYEEGWEHYLQFFEDVAPQHHAVGEATPTYMCSSETACRIHEHLPNARLIAILRDPVDRAYSHYWNIVAEQDRSSSMSYAAKKEAFPFSEVLDQYSRLIEDGLYARNLKPFFERFGADRIQTLIFEEVIQDPVQYFQRVYRFLDVDEHFESPLLKRNINSSSQKHGRSSLMLRLYNFVTAYINVPVLARFIENVNEVSYPSMDPEVRAHLADRFAEPNRELATLLGRPIPEWETNRLQKRSQ